LGYEIEAKINTIDFDTHQDLVPVGVSPLAPIVQDVRDVIRQEYVDYGAILPLRSQINYYGEGVILNNGNYEFVVNEVDSGLATLYNQYIEQYNSLIRFDEQVIDVGVSNLPADSIIVSPAGAVSFAELDLEISSLRNTILEGDDELLNGNIVAGLNGIADTTANNVLGDIKYLVPVSSGYRNPQKNRAVGSNYVDSYHTRGRAIDFTPPANIPGVGSVTELNIPNTTLTTLKYCIMKQAGEFAARSNTEINNGSNTAVSCTYTPGTYHIDHVHLRN
ncbi:MAG: hypothetical protein GY820_22585, partial [Gammaproteobacteria bacterium]|nr:hypothetical protein [Gammaproteobacteria bacterium]